MSFQGDIKSFPLCDVIQNLVANKKTGTLTIQTDTIKPCIQFEDGNVISYADDKGFSIGCWLADKDIVPRNRMDEALKRYRRAKKKTLGQILRDLKIIDLDEYTKYVKYLVWESLCDVLALSEGTFRFREGSLDFNEGGREIRALGLKFSPSSLIMEAARRVDDWEMIRRHMPSENEFYSISPSQREHLIEQADDELTAQTVQLLDGTRPLGSVIARLPFSRFEVCCCLSSLISSKAAKPIDSAQVVERSGDGRDPQSAIACLEAILEREPNNREVLKRLADLYECQEDVEQAAKHHKLLAVSYFEEGDLARAKSRLQKSLELNPKDVITWQKLWDCVRTEGKDEQVQSFGEKYVRHFQKLGLTEMVRERLIELIQIFPEHRTFRLALAEARFSLGEQKKAVQELTDFGHELLRLNHYDLAEAVFERVVKYDHQNNTAHEVLDEIRSGKLKRRKAFHRRLLHSAVAMSCLVSVGVIAVREMAAQRSFFNFTREVFAESLLEEKRYSVAIGKIEEVSRKHPYTFTAHFGSASLIEILDDKRHAFGEDSQLDAEGDE